MKLLIVCALALAYTTPCVLGQGRIFNGKDAAPGQFPYQARIEVDLGNGVFSCGASLIATDWVLTAAHCVYGGLSATVYLGTTDLYNGATIRRVSAKNLIAHINYNDYTLENDIALIKIHPVTLTEYIQIVKLPVMGPVNFNYANRNVTASGWGRKGNAATTTYDLQWTTLKVLRNQQCQNIHRIAIQRGMICATGEDYSSTCKGDSGGPLVLTNTNIQVGIVSWGSRFGCEVGLPGVFARITFYLPWIKKISGVFYQ